MALSTIITGVNFVIGGDFSDERRRIHGVAGADFARNHHGDCGSNPAVDSSGHTAFGIAHQELADHHIMEIVQAVP